MTSNVNPLPDVRGLLVAADTETSGLFVDSGARASVVSWAFRVPQGPREGELVKFAAAFDQGQDPLALFTEEELTEPYRSQVLPLGPKQLPARHEKRIKRWFIDHGLDVYLAPNRQPDAWGRLVRWLSQQNLVFHNAKFDAHMFAAGLRGREDAQPERGGGLELIDNVVGDTQLAQFVLDPYNGTALKPTSVRLGLGQELGLDEGTEDAEADALKPWKGPKTDPRYDLIPWRVIKPYAALDAALTYLLHEYHAESLADPAFQFEIRHVARETDLMRTLFRMERRGIGYDVEASRGQVAIIDRLAAEQAAELPFKPTYPGAQKYFFGLEVDEYGEPTGCLGHLPYNDKLTANGNPQVDEETIERLAGEGVPHAAEFKRYAELMSAKSKWYQAWADLTGTDGRLRTNHKQAHVVSGRLSVERAQLQAIPQNYQIPDGLIPVRRFFRPKPGHQLWEVDVSQAEPRIATAIARCQQMLDLILRGYDSHSAACWLMFRNQFERDGYGEPELASGTDGGQPHPMWGEYRQVSKRCNLGIIYGAGAKTVRQEILKFTGIDYPLNQVRDWISEWRAAFPPFVRALDNASRKAQREGWVRLINGRIRVFSPYEPVHKAFNQVIQGSQAEILKDVMVAVDRKYPDTLLLSIHDSLVLELPEDEAELIVKDVRQIMIDMFEQAFERAWVRGGPLVRVPFDADAKRWDAA